MDSQVAAFPNKNHISQIEMWFCIRAFRNPDGISFLDVNTTIEIEVTLIPWSSLEVKGGADLNPILPQFNQPWFHDEKET
jgi:hypothetical protein